MVQRWMLVLSLIAWVGSGCSSLQKKGSSFQLRPFQEIEFKNGMKVLLIRDHSLPYISYQMLLKTGFAEDPIARSGLTSFVGRMLVKGTKGKGASQIADELDFLGAELDVSTDADHTLISADGLSHTQDALLGLFSDVIMKPTFDQQEIERLRRLILAEIKKEVDDPSSFASTNFLTYLYGSHPYARSAQGRSRDVRAIRKKEIIRHYLAHYRPNNAFLAVSGSFGDEMLQKLENVFGSWSSRSVEGVVFPALSSIDHVQVLVLDKADLTQAQIRIGHPGIKRTDPDFLPLRVANTILGGAFASRLNDRIRKDLGLTYGVHSFFDARVDVGPFTISTFTRNEKIGETVLEALKIYKQMVIEGVKEEEVKGAVGYLKGKFPQSIETGERLAMNLLLLRRYGIPDTYLTQHLIDLDRITSDDVNRVSRKHFRPEHLKVFVYAPSKVALPQLQPVGVVEVKGYKDFL